MLPELSWWAYCIVLIVIVSVAVVTAIAIGPVAVPAMPFLMIP